MLINDSDNLGWQVVIYLFIIISFASLASYFYKQLNSNKLAINTLIAQIVISIFVAILIFLTVSYFDLSFVLAVHDCLPSRLLRNNLN